MKILFDDYIKNATISSLNESANYPAANLQVPRLRKRYQNADGTDTITISLDAARTVNCLFFGYHNAASGTMAMNLKNASGTTLYTQTITMGEQIDAIHFAAVALVKTVELVLSWSTVGIAAGYLGGVGCGLSYTMPDPIAEWEDALQDNSVVEENPFGQVFTDRIEARITRSYNFAYLERVDYVAIKNAMALLGVGVPTWVDIADEAHTFMAALFATVSMQGGKHADEYDSFSMTFKEAR